MNTFFTIMCSYSSFNNINEKIIFDLNFLEFLINILKINIDHTLLHTLN